MARKKNKIELEELFTRLTNKVTANFDIDELVLFGSYAKGLEHDQSDIDVALISPDLDPAKLTYQNTLRVKRKSDLLEPDLQLFAFNSDNYYNHK
ncbi:MAG: nucleotidyltransferase domain-containing protein, partial [Candidatus Melainabacteria bacterium]|nr:nucleotidyltransferase domain-containing protein [Candidatus Melainabacteria bacterium]